MSATTRGFSTGLLFKSNADIFRFRLPINPLHFVKLFEKNVIYFKHLK